MLASFRSVSKSCQQFDSNQPSGAVVNEDVDIMSDLEFEDSDIDDEQTS